MIIYSTGYLGKRTQIPGIGKLEAFERMVERRNLVVCDTRFRPYSRGMGWCRANLEAQLGTDRYHWIPGFGNSNFHTAGKPIAIRDFTEGVDDLLAIMSTTGRTPLLLCACENHAECHRFELALLLMRKGTVEEVREIHLWDGDIYPSRPLEFQVVEQTDRDREYNDYLDAVDAQVDALRRGLILPPEMIGAAHDVPAGYRTPGSHPHV